MSYQKARKALDTRLATVSGLEVFYENTDASSPEGEVYATTAMLNREPETGSVGQGGYDRIGGVYAVNVHAHRNTGSGESIGVAEQILAAFSRGQQITADGFTITIERAWVGPSFQDGSRFVTPCSIIWFAFK